MFSVGRGGRSWWSTSGRVIEVRVGMVGEGGVLRDGVAGEGVFG